METYTTIPTRFKEIRKQTFTRILPLILIAVIAGVVISSSNQTQKQGDIYNWLITIPIIGAAVGFGLVRGLNRQKAIFESYKLTIEGNLITREQFNSSAISIYFDDINEIIGNKNGSFTIKVKNGKDTIYVPAQIENYSHLEKSLSRIMPIKVKDQGAFQQLSSIVAAVSVIVLMICVYTVSNKLIVGVAGIVLIGLLLWSFIAIRKNKNIDAKTKTAAWWVFIVIIAVVAIMYQKLAN